MKIHYHYIICYWFILWTILYLFNIISFNPIYPLILTYLINLTILLYITNFNFDYIFYKKLFYISFFKLFFILLVFIKNNFRISFHKKDILFTIFIVLLYVNFMTILRINPIDVYKVLYYDLINFNKVTYYNYFNTLYLKK